MKCIQIKLFPTHMVLTSSLKHNFSPDSLCSILVTLKEKHVHCHCEDLFTTELHRLTAKISQPY